MLVVLLAAAALSPGRPSAHIARRDALVGALGLVAALAPRSAALADDELAISPPPLAVAYFSSGDARFLQPSLDGIKYLGVVRTTPGSLTDAEGLVLPALRVEYKASKIPYKRLVGSFWRSHDPTRTAAEGQFGRTGPSVIWAASQVEADVASQSKVLLERCGLTARTRGWPGGAACPTS